MKFILINIFFYMSKHQSQFIVKLKAIKNFIKFHLLLLLISQSIAVVALCIEDTLGLAQNKKRRMPQQVKHSPVTVTYIVRLPR